MERRPERPLNANKGSRSYPEMSPTYHFVFSCGHNQSHSAILVSRKSIRHFPRPCVRCEPNTPLGQALIREMVSLGGSPHLTASGDIVIGAAPAGSIGALKLVPKLKAPETEKEVEKSWDNRRRASQQCLVH